LDCVLLLDALAGAVMSGVDVRASSVPPCELWLIDAAGGGCTELRAAACSGSVLVVDARGSVLVVDARRSVLVDARGSVLVVDARGAVLVDARGSVLVVDARGSVESDDSPTASATLWRDADTALVAGCRCAGSG